MQQIRNEAVLKRISQFLNSTSRVDKTVSLRCTTFALSILTAIKFQLFDLTIRIILKIRDTNQVL